MASLTFEYSPFKSTYTVTSNRGMRWGKMHQGIDLVVNGSDKSVVSTTSGKVVYSGWGESGTGYGNYGNCVAIETNGYVILYAHLANNSIPSSVKVGSTIAAGTVIGTQGNTGASKGDHLHLEVRVNGEYRNTIDPAKLLNGELLTSDESSSANNSVYDEDWYDSDGVATGDAEVPFTPTQIVGRRASVSTSQPAHAYVNIYLGDKLLSTDPPKPQVIQDFEVTIIQDNFSANFTLFDDRWDVIEPLLAAYYDDINVQFGWSGIGLDSEIHKFQLASYNIDFHNTGVLLHVSALYKSGVENLTSVNLELDTYNPTEAVKKICESQGWTVLDENFDESEDVARDNPYNLVNDYPIQYIQNVIVPESQNNGEIFKFILDSNKVAYFKEYTYNIEEENVVKTYIYQKGYDNPILDLNVDVKAVFGGTTNFQIATGLTSSVFGTTSKESTTVTETLSSTITESSGDLTHTNSDQSIATVESAGDTAEQVQNQLYYYVKNASNAVYEATMTILGDPEFALTDNVRLLNITDDGYMHHTSGIYWVNGITHTIADGNYTTTLSLVRNGNVNEGVELLHPKNIVK